VAGHILKWNFVDISQARAVVPSIIGHDVLLEVFRVLPPPLPATLPVACQLARLARAAPLVPGVVGFYLNLVGNIFQTPHNSVNACDSAG